jgi:hypothetical protein
MEDEVRETRGKTMAETTEERRKSLGLLKEITSGWSAEPGPEKYTRNEEEPPQPRATLKMSSMEEESVRERLRMSLLRQSADILDTEPKYTRETFRRAFLNKVSLIFTPQLLLQMITDIRSSIICRFEFLPQYLTFLLVAPAFCKSYAYLPFSIEIIDIIQLFVQ